MAYSKTYFQDGDTLTASHMNTIEDGIISVENTVKQKQDKLVSGTNLVTVNGQSLLGAGNIQIEPENTVIDDKLSSTSVNPVQNKVVKNALDTLTSSLGTTVDALAEVSNTLNDTITVLGTKQDALSASDFKTVNGQSVFGAGEITISGDGSSITVDSSLSSTSTNPVQNKIVTASLAGKQDTLVSGTSLKTINGQSLLGSGNITVEGGEQVTAPQFTDAECREAFLNEMNVKASKIGMKDTVFTDPTGRTNLTTAHDMCRCVYHASGYEKLNDIWATPSQELTFFKADGSVRKATITHGLIASSFTDSYNVVGGKGGSLSGGTKVNDSFTVPSGKYLSNMSCILQSKKNPDDFYAITTLSLYSNSSTAYATKIQAIKDVMQIIESNKSNDNGSTYDDSALDEIAYEGKTYRTIFVTSNLAPDINHGKLYNNRSNSLTYTLNNAPADPVLEQSDELVDNFVPPYSAKVSASKSLNWLTSHKAGKYFAACNVNITSYTAGRLGILIGVSGVAFAGATSATEGYVTATCIANVTSNNDSAFYLGSSSQANLTGYINNPVIIDMSMFTTQPSEQVLAELYANFNQKLRDIYVLNSDSGTESLPVELPEPQADCICAFKLPKYNARGMQNRPLAMAYSKDPYTLYPPASMTKIMTAMVTLDYCQDLYEKVTMKQEDKDALGGSVWYGNDIQVGETATVKDIMHIMLMPSSNVATEILRRFIGEKIMRSKTL